jgi:CBS domain-containing protein
MKAEDVMTTRVITVTENHTKQEAARLLAEHRISGQPVVNTTGRCISS